MNSTALPIACEAGVERGGMRGVRVRSTRREHEERARGESARREHEARAQGEGAKREREAQLAGLGPQTCHKSTSLSDEVATVSAMSEKV